MQPFACIQKERYYAELRPYLLSKLPWHDKTLELWLQMAWPSTWHDAAITMLPGAGTFLGHSDRDIA